ncbi:hypothetical protein BDQ17DRAFT_1430323 [Cyathus striatus]|nr:hypothetical protein BDQ17DRAFT_1430323 [Cyathus striatus]
MFASKGVSPSPGKGDRERDTELAAVDPQHPILLPVPLNWRRPKPLQRRIQRFPLILPLLLTPPLLTKNPNIAVLNSSLPAKDANGKEEHHPTSSVSVCKAGLGKEKGQHKIKWHFGIRSRSPPMEVMLEIYRTLKALGMEWKENKDLGGLRDVRPTSPSSPSPHDKIERNRDLDGSGGVDVKKAAGISFVETRARVQDASTEPGAGKFDMASPDLEDGVAASSAMYGSEVYAGGGGGGASVSTTGVGSVGANSVMAGSGGDGEDEVVSPFVFMGVACRLILELAGGGSSRGGSSGA